MDLLRSGVTTRLTLDNGPNVFPIWSPDGNRIAFASTRKGRHDLYARPVAGSGSDDVLLEDAQDKFPSDWSGDGKSLLFSSSIPRPSTTFGPYRSPAIVSRFPLFKPRSKNSQRSFRRTASGSYFSLTNRAGLKSTRSPSPGRVPR